MPDEDIHRSGSFRTSTWEEAGMTLPVRRTKAPLLRITSAVLLPLVGAVTACSEPLEFADWTVPVPEGARVIEYADVPLSDRDTRVELVEDLVIGPRGDDPDYLFFRPQSVGVDGDGRMYVVEMGNLRVQVFDADGEYLRTLGQEGQGPGEFQMPIDLTVAGDRVVVNDWRNLRLSSWNLEGVHLGDVSVSRLEADMFGIAGGAFVGADRRRSEDGTRLIDISRYSSEGAVELSYAAVPEPESLVIGNGPAIVMPRLTGGPSYVAGEGGEVYVTAGQQYQILAFEPDGSARWALRVARSAEPFGPEHIETLLAPLRERTPDIDTAEVEWPGSLYTISRLEVDGHGHLYVFPYYFRDLGPDEIPVEVYDTDGERLFAGTMRESGWSAAHGDFVYRLRSNPDTDESELVRYRLIEPFDRGPQGAPRSSRSIERRQGAPQGKSTA